MRLWGSFLKKLWGQSRVLARVTFIPGCSELEREREREVGARGWSRASETFISYLHYIRFRYICVNFYNCNDCCNYITKGKNRWDKIGESFMWFQHRLIMITSVWRKGVEIEGEWKRERGNAARGPCLQIEEVNAADFARNNFDLHLLPSLTLRHSLILIVSVQILFLIYNHSLQSY